MLNKFSYVSDTDIGHIGPFWASHGDRHPLVASQPS